MSDTYRKHLPKGERAKRGKMRSKLQESQRRGGKSPAEDRKAVRSYIRSRGAIHHDVHDRL